MDQLDREDWAGFANGDRGGIARIYNRHKDTLYTFCLYVTGDRQLSEDVVQETFLTLMKNRHTLDVKSSLKGWLFICARNLTYNLLKRRPEPPYHASNEKSAASVETQLFIENVLSRLTIDERELILLREHQQFSVRELSEMLDLSEEAVRVRLYRIRKKMQSLVKRKS
jgi:RNA polymerase sigma-70 factor (ECF subfamily)